MQVSDESVVKLVENVNALMKTIQLKLYYQSDSLTRDEKFHDDYCIGVFDSNDQLKEFLTVKKVVELLEGFIKENNL